MRPLFPGMDPWLEHPALWADVHNSLIAAVRDDLAPRVAPRYYIGLERRAYLLDLDDLVFVGRPDPAFIPSDPARSHHQGAVELGPGVVDVVEVDVPMEERVEETFLEVHEVGTGTLITVLELLSPANKLHDRGRAGYEAKRAQILSSRTNLVEIALLREGRAMPLRKAPPKSDYRILVSRGVKRPRAQLYPFALRQAVPQIRVPLLPSDVEPELDIGGVLHALYERARFDLRLDYAKPPVSPLNEADTQWARGIARGGG